MCRPLFIALRYSLDGNASWPAVQVELVSTAVNNATNISRYSDETAPSSACSSSNVVSLTLPQLTAGSCSPLNR